MAEARATGVDPIALDPGVVRPLSRTGWDARVTRLTALDTSIDLVSLDPHEFDSTTSRLRFRPSVLVVAVASGRLHGTAGDQPFEALPGQALLVDTREPLHARIDEPVRLLRMVVDQRRLRGSLPQRAPLPTAVLSESPVTSTCLGAVNTLLHRSQAAGTQDDDRAIAQLVAGLQLSLLDEAVRQRTRSVEARVFQSRREQIEHFIYTHIDDPDLAPAAIARALGMSVRSVHAAFDDSAETVGSTIRAQRVARLLDTARSRGCDPSIDDLVVSCGFRDAAQMARAFRSATGVSFRTWAKQQRDA